MIEPADLYETFRRHGLTFFTGVPDSLLKDFCAYVADHTPPDRHVINANEGSALALAAGYYLATGAIPVVYLQNSGIGNTINPLLSLVDPAVYGIPVLFVIGWRGEPGIPDEPQHVRQGAVMQDLLDAVGLSHDVIDADTRDLDGLVGFAVARMNAAGGSHALLVRKGTFVPYALAGTTQSDPPLTRAEVIATILALLGPDDLLVSTTGMTSREVFALREERGEGHDRDFLTVGSMGHCSQIALGLAQHRPERQIVCLDGDGAVIMHMGSLAIIGSQRPANFKHVVINNAAHDSVGGQPTAAGSVDLAALAVACGYRHAASAATVEDLDVSMRTLLGDEGPALLEARVQSTPWTNAGRPTTTPAQNKTGFMRSLDHGRV